MERMYLNKAWTFQKLSTCIETIFIVYWINHHVLKVLYCILRKRSIMYLKIFIVYSKLFIVFFKEVHHVLISVYENVHAVFREGSTCTNKHLWRIKNCSSRFWKQFIAYWQNVCCILKVVYIVFCKNVHHIFK